MIDILPRTEKYFPELNNQNMLFYMAVNYNDVSSEGTVDFLEDVKRIKYIKRLLSSYTESGDLKIRLLLNHIIVLVNQFGPFPASRILLYKIGSKYHDIVVTILHELNVLDKSLYEFVTLDPNIQRLIHKELDK